MGAVEGRFDLLLLLLLLPLLLLAISILDSPLEVHMGDESFMTTAYLFARSVSEEPDLLWSGPSRAGNINLDCCTPPPPPPLPPANSNGSSRHAGVPAASCCRREVRFGERGSSCLMCVCSDQAVASTKQS